MTKIEGLDENLSPQPNDWIPIQPPGQKIKKVKLGNLTINVDTTALQAEIDQKADIAHSHTQFSDLQQQINTKASQSVVNDKANSSDVTHALATKVDNATLANTVSELQGEIDGKAPAIHQHHLANIIDYSFQTRVFRQQTAPSNSLIGDKWEQVNLSNLLINNWFWDGRYWKSNIKFFTFSVFNQPLGSAILGLNLNFAYHLLRYQLIAYNNSSTNTVLASNPWIFTISKPTDLYTYGSTNNLIKINNYSNVAPKAKIEAFEELNVFLNSTQRDNDSVAIRLIGNNSPFFNAYAECFYQEVYR